MGKDHIIYIFPVAKEAVNREENGTKGEGPMRIKLVGVKRGIIGGQEVPPSFGQLEDYITILKPLL